MSERLQIKRASFSAKFKIVRFPSGQIIYQGQWTKNGIQMEVTDQSGAIVFTASKKSPKGIHLAWKEKFEISFPEQHISTVLSCIKPLKNLWEARIDQTSYKLNSPLRRDVEVHSGKDLLLKEIKEDDFYLKTADHLRMIASLAFYLCIRQQHTAASSAD